MSTVAHNIRPYYSGYMWEVFDHTMRTDKRGSGVWMLREDGTEVQVLGSSQFTVSDVKDKPRKIRRYYEGWPAEGTTT